MLQMRPNCECCNRDLPADSVDAFICSFECTFCSPCAIEKLKGRCPNCDGALLPRPTRARAHWAQNPPSVVRVLKPDGCRV